jgi:hypothetical protein
MICHRSPAGVVPFLEDLLPPGRGSSSTHPAANQHFSNLFGTAANRSAAWSKSLQTGFAGGAHHLRTKGPSVMGLTIHYRLRSTTRSPTRARELVRRLRSRALDLPFERVDDIIELQDTECDFQEHDDKYPYRWLLIQTRQLVPDPRDEGCRHSVNPLHVVAFSTWPGNGCEEANFGLCRYPATIEVGRWARRTIRTNLGPWCWGSFCKTQYASNPDCGGVPNFFRCHLSVVAMLDHAQSLGILDEAYDEGDYWQKRDVPALAREVGEWNDCIAQQVAELRSVFGSLVQSPVVPATREELTDAAFRR